MHGQWMPIGVRSTNIAKHLAPTRSLHRIEHTRSRVCTLITRIVDLSPANPEHRIGAIAGDDVSPLLLHSGDTHRRQMLKPGAHDRGYDPRTDQILNPPIGKIEVFGVDLSELRVPHRAAFVPVAWIDG